MSVVLINNYIEDGRLTDLDLVAFLKKKLERGDKLDFSGVVEVAPELLDLLFVGLTPEQAADTLTQLSPEADAAIAAWTDRTGAKVTPAERGSKRSKVRLPAPAGTPPTPTVLERAPSGDERFTPTRLVKRLQETLRGYIESAYPLSDPTLVRARRRLLQEEAGGHLLAQEPYIETTTRYVTSQNTYLQLGLPSHIAELFSELSQTLSAQSAPGNERTVLHPSMYVHQEMSFREFLGNGRDIVIATGTGSGKTECFLVPMLGCLYDEAVKRPASFAQHGVRALILYPMNALVNDQLSRLRLLLGDPTVATAFRRLGAGRRVPRFGVYPGRRAGQALARLLSWAVARGGGASPPARPLPRQEPAGLLRRGRGAPPNVQERKKDGSRVHRPQLGAATAHRARRSGAAHPSRDGARRGQPTRTRPRRADHQLLHA